MKKLMLLLICLLALAALTGCKCCHSGSREYTPGKGWTPTR
jgi:hypothetical protein